MQLSKKGLFAIIAIVALITTATAVGFHVFYEIPTCDVSIAGIGIEVYDWFEGETLGALITAIDFGLLVPPEKGYSQQIVLVADCNGVDETITWDSTLDPTVGSIKLEVEVCTEAWVGGADYEWQDLAPGFVMTDHQTLGFRGDWESAQLGDYGHLRIVLQTLLDATRGEYSFTITFYGDQT